MLLKWGDDKAAVDYKSSGGFFQYPSNPFSDLVVMQKMHVITVKGGDNITVLDVQTRS